MSSSAIPVAELKRCVVLADNAYLKRLDFVKSLESVDGVALSVEKGNLVFIEDPATNTQAYAFVADNTCFVVFRGSQESMDVINDLDFEYSQLLPNTLGCDPKIKVHTGFKQCFDSVSERVYNFLDSTTRQRQFASVVFCGHSMGGALATIAAALFAHHQDHQKDKKTVKLFTFGSPRVGNSAFAAYVNVALATNCHWRVFNNNDPLTKLPSRTAIYEEPYTHVGGNSLRLYSKEGVNGAAWRYRCKVESGDLEAISLGDAISPYHLCGHYLECLGAI